MTIRIAIAGVGNCANALIQGVTFYADAADDAVVPGLMHTKFGPHAIRDMTFVAAFDVDAEKVGTDLATAIWASKNDTFRFSEVAATGVTVQRGPTLDGLGQYYREAIVESDAPPVDVVQSLRDSGADVL
ncbi:MAG: inositol-3-phosphate synthase, partial [Glaciihabitans sp.]|nr:inositol-3-phosphate synthase [Glaciihabitans sp.]